jgi:ribosomal protein L37AE/L43A
MRIRKVSASQFRCNFCLDWHVSKTPQLSSINICEQCFSKAHSSSYFKVTHPKDLEVY